LEIPSVIFEDPEACRWKLTLHFLLLLQEHQPASRETKVLFAGAERRTWKSVRSNASVGVHARHRASRQKNAPLRKGLLLPTNFKTLVLMLM
jgi:hypothetical protein